MKYLLLLSLINFVACSHHHKGEDHHHHDGKANYTKSPKDVKAAYDHQCADSVKEGDKHVAGKEEFQLEHRGRFYYFSSEEKMENFKKNLEANIKQADTNWGYR